MELDAGLGAERTTEERCEYLLTVIACALTHQRPHQFVPWMRTGTEVFDG